MTPCDVQHSIASAMLQKHGAKYNLNDIVSWTSSQQQRSV
jgi:hypothetical protein